MIISNEGKKKWILLQIVSRTFLKYKTNNLLTSKMASAVIDVTTENKQISTNNFDYDVISTNSVSLDNSMVKKLIFKLFI